MSESTLLKLPQVAERLALSHSAVRRLVCTGVLPVVRVGPRSIRFSPGDVDQFIRRATNERIQEYAHAAH